jgi:GntR family transcriptional regulator
VSVENYNTAMNTARALERSGVARYIQLAGLFRHRIENGDWEVGMQIPTVETLAKECGVANMTIRQALTILEREDLIERFRAKGTFVKNRPQHDLWCEVHTDLSGMLIARAGAQIEVLTDDRNVSLPPSNTNFGTPAASYRHLRRRHTRGNQAFLLADLYIDEAICDQISDEDLTSKTAMRLVFDIAGAEIVDARQVLTIGSADLETSSLLGLPISDPIAKVRRHANRADGSILILANGIYRGDMVSIEMKLK